MNRIQVVKIDRIAWPTEYGFMFTSRTDVAYCQADGSYTKVQFENGVKIVVSHKIKIIEQLLGGSPYFRIHESYLVNLYHVSRLTRRDGSWFLCVSDFEMPVAKARQKALISNFATLSEAKQTLSGTRSTPGEMLVDGLKI